MDIDAEKLEQTVLALLYLNSFDDRSGGKRAWKALPWSAMDQLHEKGYISDPATKNKSVWLSEEGVEKSFHVVLLPHSLDAVGEPTLCREKLYKNGLVMGSRGFYSI